VSKRSDGEAPEDPPAGPEAQAGRADRRPDRTQAAPGEPPRRESQLELGGHLAFPDDGPLARGVRRLDGWLGRAEQVVLVALLATVVLTAGGHALLDRFGVYRLEMKDEIVRAGTFAIALLGAAFASHQGRHLSMDLVSRRLSPRARLFLKVLLALFTITIVVLVVRSGLHLIDREKHEEHLLSTRRIALLIPIGGALIIIHTILHTIIDVDYIVRRKTPPERMRSAH
jgi:TRAP-type C4-dicarboxylate transport system permease small subunit